MNFYPRPPRGGRRRTFLNLDEFGEFLSTPSARRATDSDLLISVEDDISIHALREEGDLHPTQKPVELLEFLSTPSARRATDD